MLKTICDYDSEHHHYYYCYLTQQYTSEYKTYPKQYDQSKALTDEATWKKKNDLPKQKMVSIY